MTDEERSALAKFIVELRVGFSMLRGEVNVLRGVLLAQVQANQAGEADRLTRAHIEAARTFSLFESMDDDREAAVEAVSSMFLAAIANGRDSSDAAMSQETRH